MDVTIPFGEAVVLIAGAADLHDDIIDQSSFKGSRKTVFGKFGSIDTILAGDTMLLRGLMLLNEASSLISKEQSEIMNTITAKAIFELCSAESLESQLRNLGLNIKPIEYNEVINLKVGFPEMTCRMGAILGNGDLESIETLGKFGRTFGVISTIADEFSDFLNSDELTNRLNNECPPLPLIYALQSRQAKTAVLKLLKADLTCEKAHEALLNLVFGLSEMKSFIETLETTVANEMIEIEKIDRKSREELTTILLAPLEFLKAACSS